MTVEGTVQYSFIYPSISTYRNRSLCNCHSGQEVEHFQPPEGFFILFPSKHLEKKPKRNYDFASITID